jgi:hypothetical protein
LDPDGRAVRYPCDGVCCPVLHSYGYVGLATGFRMGQASLLFAYTPDCYPTEIRNSGAGLAYGVGRLENVFRPLFVAFLFTRYGYTSVFACIATLLVAMTVGGFGPRTEGKTLV